MFLLSCLLTLLSPPPPPLFPLTAAKPSLPSVELKGAPLSPGATVGPLQEGDVLSLTCRTQGGKPPPKVAWFKGDVQLSAQLQESKGERGAGDVAATFATALSRQDLGSRFECTAVNEALETPLRAWVELDLHGETRRACRLHTWVNALKRSLNSPNTFCLGAWIGQMHKRFRVSCVPGGISPSRLLLDCSNNRYYFRVVCVGS